MYLYCYTLDLRSNAVRKALRTAYEIHRTVMSAYRMVDSDNPRKDMGVLYRLYSLGNTQKLYVSSIEKAVNEMPEGFIKEAGSPKNLAPVLESISIGMVLSFDIMTMPSKKVQMPDSKNSKRIFLSKEVDREEWLHKKASQNGFEILTFTEKNSIDNRIKNGNFNSIVFQGTLKIADREKFLNAYKYGIGAEKAFGCGMLLLYKA